MKELDLKINENELSLILLALGKLPAEHSFELIMKLTSTLDVK